MMIAADTLPPSRVGKAEGRNLTFSMVEDLGRAIVAGHYDRQRFPTENELAERYAVSRTVMREAVKMLTAKGLLRGRAGSGTAVQPPARWSMLDTDVVRWLLAARSPLPLLRHFTQLRLAIEPQAAALAASEPFTRHHAAIGEALQDMEAALAADEGGLIEADIAFHVAVLKASGNPFFMQFEDLITTTLRTSIRHTHPNADGESEAEMHGAVYRAIHARDPAAAAAAMLHMLMKVMRRVAQSTT